MPANLECWSDSGTSVKPMLFYIPNLLIPHLFVLKYHKNINCACIFCTFSTYFAPCLTVFFRIVVIARLQLRQWRCLLVLQRQSEPRHVANPKRSMQCTTVGLTGICNPKPITAHTETRKVRYRKKVCT